MKVTFLPLCLLAFLFIFPSQTFVAQASAATITVNTTTDTNLNNGLCTLREAIANANMNSQFGSTDCTAGSGTTDTINFAASLANQTILLTFQINISSSITIDALAVPNVSVSGGGAVRVFNITPGALVVMTGFRITGGNGGDGGGGAIQNSGDLTLNNMVIEANAARTSFSGGGILTTGAGSRLTINNSSILGNFAADGGGIAGQSGSIINLTNVTVSGNTAANNGGGIYTAGGTLNISGGSITNNTATDFSGGGIFTFFTTVTVTNASITNNHADGSTGGFGGGIYISGGSSTITNSTVSGNTALRRGGGAYFSGSGTHSITGTTLSGNRAGIGTAANNFSGGGGLTNEGATVNISNSTVSGNSSGCNCGGGGITTFVGGTTNLRNVTIANNTAFVGPGGGITSIVGISAPGTNNLGNTIVADNTATSNPDVNGAIVSQGFNLVRTRGSSTGYDDTTDLPNGSNPMLGALADNGGPTQTHRLLVGSAAVDTGSNALANAAGLTTDQRGAGFARIVDGDGNGTATVDIGAFEVQQAPTAASVSVSGRVVTSQGRGIRNVVITMTDSSGNTRTARTTSFGYYRFEEVAAGETYIFTVSGKRFTFGQNSHVHSIVEDTNNINFIADEQLVF